MATALSCVLDELPCVHYSMLLLGGTVKVAPYATFGTPELADAVADALEGRTAALMANHGAVAYARRPRGRGRGARCCSSGRARSTGARARSASPQTLDEDQRDAVVEAALERGYGSTEAGAGRE